MLKTVRVAPQTKATYNTSVCCLAYPNCKNLSHQSR